MRVQDEGAEYKGHLSHTLSARERLTAPVERHGELFPGLVRRAVAQGRAVAAHLHPQAAVNVVNTGKSHLRRSCGSQNLVLASDDQQVTDSHYAPIPSHHHHATPHRDRRRSVTNRRLAHHHHARCQGGVAPGAAVEGCFKD